MIVRYWWFRLNYHTNRTQYIWHVIIRNTSDANHSNLFMATGQILGSCFPIKMKSTVTTGRGRQECRPTTERLVFIAFQTHWYLNICNQLHEYMRHKLNDTILIKCYNVQNTINGLSLLPSCFMFYEIEANYNINIVNSFSFSPIYRTRSPTATCIVVSWSFFIPKPHVNYTKR